MAASARRIDSCSPAMLRYDVLLPGVRTGEHAESHQWNEVSSRLWLRQRLITEVYETVFIARCYGVRPRRR